MAESIRSSKRNERNNRREAMLGKMIVLNFILMFGGFFVIGPYIIPTLAVFNVIVVFVQLLKYLRGKK